MRYVPPSVRDDVTKLLYTAADALDWETLPGPLKVEQYQRWVDDPSIGAVIGQYTPDVHGWIKDIPMKEYARALEGLGRFAQFAPRRYAGPEVFVPRALGSHWTIVQGSMGDKPAHCSVTDGEVIRYACWGKPSALRDLIWAAVTETVEDKVRPVVIVSLRHEAEELPAGRRRQRQVGARCGVDLVHMVRSLERRD
ncbi:hypothetical protein GAR06_03887 [Micromonospora saelicesensis]|nr:hypothetical protein GAR06_03887 [Micromonospora saelicesensis]